MKRERTEYTETEQRPVGDNKTDETPTKRTVVDDDRELSTSQKIAKGVYTLAGIIIGLIVVRFLFLLLGANPQNGFAEFIYAVTAPLVSPFYGLFGNQYTVEGVQFEIESLIAILFWALIGWVIVRLLTITKPDRA